MKDKITPALIGCLAGFFLMWMTFASTAVARPDMENYVQETAVEHLKILREDLRDLQKTMTGVGERLAAVEAVLRERD